LRGEPGAFLVVGLLRSVCADFLHLISASHSGFNALGHPLPPFNL
jgi:hypothetical protein